MLPLCEYKIIFNGIKLINRQNPTAPICQTYDIDAENIMCFTVLRMHLFIFKGMTVKPVLSSHSKEDQILDFKTDYCLMQVKSIAVCSKGSILHYF